MANTTNFGWETPDDTDLVKDGAAAMRTLGNSIDASFVDLKGGTTGQVLSKNSNTDLDFTWVAQDDSNAIQNSIVDAKADLITATANDTPARLAVGNNGEQLLADSSATTGLRWTGTPSASNPVINGGMDIWQRGTSISIVANDQKYIADRWVTQTQANQAITVSRQATGDTTNLPNLQYCMRYQRNSGQTGTTDLSIINALESADSIPYAGKTVTLSFYARKGADFSAASSTLTGRLRTGTGTDQNPFNAYTGSVNTINTAFTLTTTWQRFSATGTIPTNVTEFALQIFYAPSGTAGTNDYYEITGVQVDVGSVALPFRRAGNTLAGELAACQRYYFRNNSGNTNYSFFGWGIGQNPNVLFAINCPVTMRTTPTTVDFNNLGFARTGAITNVSSLVHSNSSPSVAFLQSDGASTTDVIYRLIANNSSSAYVGIGAEL